MFSCFRRSVAKRSHSSLDYDSLYSEYNDSSTTTTNGYDGYNASFTDLYPLGLDHMDFLNMNRDDYRMLDFCCVVT